jgi:hypothetical protein
MAKSALHQQDMRIVHSRTVFILKGSARGVAVWVGGMRLQALL